MGIRMGIGHCLQGFLTNAATFLPQGDTDLCVGEVRSWTECVPVPQSLWSLLVTVGDHFSHFLSWELLMRLSTERERLDQVLDMGGAGSTCLP